VSGQRGTGPGPARAGARRVIRIWLPDTPEAIGGIPDGMTADVWTGGTPLPDSRDEVEVVVMPFGVRPEVIREVARLPRLRLIQLRSAGAESVFPYVPDGVTLCNARGAHDPATAEWVAGVIVAQFRGLPGFLRSQDEGTWRPRMTRPVAGQRVLIVGYGSIGAAVEQRLAGWDVTIERVARRPRPQAPGSPPVMGPGELDGALARADVVVLLVPVTGQTRGMAGARFLARMKDGALLVNAARGPIVDTAALLAEVSTGRITAALDVTDPEPLPGGHPLWRAPGVLITPHVAGMVTDGTARANEVVRAQLCRYARGEPLRNVIGPEGY
jgi:phosphoglycerate dehydrogenase-like enzyme